MSTPVTNPAGEQDPNLAPPAPEEPASQQAQAPGEQALEQSKQEEPKELSPEAMRAEIEKLRKENAQRRVESKELKARAQKWDEYELSQKTELEKAQDTAAKLQQELESRILENTQLTLAAAYEIKADDIPLLGTGTAEEMEVKAKRIQELYAGAQAQQQTPPPSQRPHEGFIPGSGQRQELIDSAYPDSWIPSALRQKNK